MKEKDTYSIQELFDLLPITIAELARRSGINEVTLARIRDGERTRRDTVNKLMLALTRVYEIPLSINNVTGVNIMHNKRLEKKEAKVSQKLTEEDAA
jgi:transcriptional regulator with XRE-family HTH domain